MPYVIAETGIDSYWSSLDGWVRNPNYATISTDVVWMERKLTDLRVEYGMALEMRPYHGVTISLEGMEAMHGTRRR